MSLKIIPYPTASGMQRALAQSPGVNIPIKYVGIGKGKQNIQLDDAGRAITDNLKESVGYLEVLKATKTSAYQWQIVIDIKEAHKGADFNFSEFTLCDPDKKVIAIYGNPDQALYAVTHVLDNALLSINLVLATFPADSITIEHHNLPIQLFMTHEIAAIDSAIGLMTLNQMRGYNKRHADELAETARRKSYELQLQEQLDNHQLAVKSMLNQITNLMNGNYLKQKLFNTTIEQGFGRLSLAIMGDEDES